MSDCLYATISIGGDLKKSLLNTFFDLISWLPADDEASVPQSEDELNEYLATRPYIVLADPEARWGQFEELEHFCKKHGLPFRRETEAKYDYCAELVVFDGKHTFTIPTLHDKPALSFENLKFYQIRGLTLERIIQLEDPFKKPLPPLRISHD